MTEVELVFSCMTLEELREAGDVIAHMHEAHLRVQRDPVTGDSWRTRGPSMALDALVFAWNREVETRYGTPPWEAGQPTEGRFGKGVLDIYEERFLLNPDGRLVRPGSTAYVRRRACSNCLVRYPVEGPDWADTPLGASSVCIHCAPALTAAIEDAGGQPDLWEGAA